MLEAERADFVAGAEKNGMTHAEAEALFDDMGSFANYAFNKSHAAAYALISYRTVYLKAHHPGAYFAALLTSVLGNQPKMAEYTAECAKFDIRVLPPDINESQMNFHASETGRGGHIRYGLLALKNVGEAFLRAILAERRHKPFASFEDFLERLSGHDLNKRQVEALIKAGAFDNLPHHRAQLLAVYETMIETLAAKNRANLAGQMDMFSMGDAAVESAPTFVYPDVRPFTLREMLMQEKEASGMFFTGQLLDDYSLCVEALEPMAINEIIPADSDGEGEGMTTLPDRTKVRVAGIITGVTQKTTKREERMAFFTVEDAGGTLECIAFPKVYQTSEEIIRPDQAVFVEGNLSVREDESPKIMVSLVGLLVENDRFRATPKTETATTPQRTVNVTPPVESPKPQPAAQAAPAPRAGDSRPQAAGSVYNPYEAMPPTRAYNPYESMPAAAQPPRQASEGTAPRPTPAAPTAPPQKLYLRVPDMEGEPYRQALNLCEIFCDGTTAVIFYDMKEKKYFATSLRLRATPFVMERLERVLGKENVVAK